MVSTQRHPQPEIEGDITSGCWFLLFLYVRTTLSKETGQHSPRNAREIRVTL